MKRFMARLLACPAFACGLLGSIPAMAAAPAAPAAPSAHFHHVHLNSVDPAAAVEFYTAKFKARKEKFAGLGDAVWTGDSWLLFSKVAAPPPSELPTHLNLSPPTSASPKGRQDT